ncbi:MAG TPA: Hsp20/alpha crystallin family protein [Acidimicrobiales bacterium]|nr:Hsp20/alpha crystallin family protein [Acidimicrobiales bacterium]
MLVLMRYDPFRDIDRLTQQLAGERRASAMPMDAYRENEHFVVHFDLPGVDPESIDLTVEKNALTVKAERSWQAGDGIDVLVAERPQGSFSRQLFLGEGLDPDRIEARYDEGVLTVTIPVAERAKARKIEVGTNGGGRAIDANSTTS